MEVRKEEMRGRLRHGGGSVLVTGRGESVG